MSSRIDSIRQRLAEATPGSWHTSQWGIGVEGVTSNSLPWAVYADAVDGEPPVALTTFRDNVVYDAALIAAAPSDLAWLLERVQELEAIENMYQAVGPDLLEAVECKHSYVPRDGELWDCYWHEKCFETDAALSSAAAERDRLREELADWRMAAWWEHAFYNEKKDAVGHDFTVDAEETEADMCTCGAEHWHTRGCKLGPQDRHRPVSLPEEAPAQEKDDG